MNPDHIAVALSDNDADARLAAIAEVAENPQVPLPDAALDALIECLGANRKVIQRRGAEALAAAAAHDPRIVEKLRAALSHPSSRARWGAAYALGLVAADDTLDLRVLPSLLEALASLDGDLRWAAAELVVRLGRKDRTAVGSRLIELARDGNLNARKMALYCLRDIGGPRDELFAAAENCCRDHHSLLKMAALSLLARIEPAPESQASRDSQAPHDARDHDDRAAALAIRLLHDDPDAGVRRCAAVALGHLGNRSAHVIAALQHAADLEGDIYMKRAVDGALARLGAALDRSA
jgi:HEAT repeat protein